MKGKERLAYAFLINLLIVIAESFVLSVNLKKSGAAIFTYYTENANLITLLSSLFFCIFAALCLLGLIKSVPQLVRILRYVGVSMLLLVVLVVALVLSPLLGGLSGAAMLFLSGTMFYHHLLCPVLSILSFWLFETGQALGRRHTAIALLPTTLYAAALLTLNALSVVKGPYPFFQVHDVSPLFVIGTSLIIFLAALGGAVLLRGRTGGKKRREAVE